MCADIEIWTHPPVFIGHLLTYIYAYTPLYNSSTTLRLLTCIHPPAHQNKPDGQNIDLESLWRAQAEEGKDLDMDAFWDHVQAGFGWYKECVYVYGEERPGLCVCVAFVCT